MWPDAVVREQVVLDEVPPSRRFPVRRIPKLKPMIVQFRTVTFEYEPFVVIPLLNVEGPACASASLNPLQSIVTLLVRMSTARMLVALVMTLCRRHQVPGVVITVGTVLMSPTQLS